MSSPRVFGLTPPTTNDVEMSTKPLQALAALDKASYRLVFKALPYAAHPSESRLSPSASYNCSFFALRGGLREKTARSEYLKQLAGRQQTPRLDGWPARLRDTNDAPRPTFDWATSSRDPTQPFLSDVRLSRRLYAREHKPYEMQLTLRVAKKLHKSQAVRERCRRRFREAVRLVVIRGANTELERGMQEDVEREITFADESPHPTSDVGPQAWLVAGGFYHAQLTLECYKQPMSLLVWHVRRALKQVKNKVESYRYERALAEALESVPKEG